MRARLHGTSLRGGARLFQTEVVVILVLMTLSPFVACAMDGIVVIISQLFGVLVVLGFTIFVVQ